jgi:deazaflavin-dependent oxidoreductase (nitroreductase family)
MNAMSAWAGSRGIAPTLMVTLETTGRRTGKTLRVPMVVAELDSDRYLVSMLGEKSDWLLNVKASKGEAVLSHGIVERVRLVEVPVAQRAPILKVYLKRAPGARPHFDINMDAALDDFARVAARYPVFRVVAIA